MVVTIEAPVNQFELLILRPRGWQVMVSSGIDVIKGDTIKYIEVNNLEIPTGRESVGIVRYVGSGDMVLNNSDVTIAYCDMIGLSIGVATVSGTLIIG